MPIVSPLCNLFCLVQRAIRLRAIILTYANALPVLRSSCRKQRRAQISIIPERF
jgi:hypothetical protein